MATVKPLVMKNGQMQVLQPGDQIQADMAVTNTRSMNNGESSAPLVFGAPAYISGSGQIKRAQANALVTSEVFGLVYEASIAAGAAGVIAVGGILVGTTAQWDAVTGQTGGLTPGARYYVDPATPGKITTTAPTTQGQVVACVGRASSMTDFEVDTEATVLL